MPLNIYMRHADGTIMEDAGGSKRTESLPLKGEMPAEDFAGKGFVGWFSSSFSSGMYVDEMKSFDDLKRMLSAYFEHEDTQLYYIHPSYINTRDVLHAIFLNPSDAEKFGEAFSKFFRPEETGMVRNLAVIHDRIKGGVEPKDEALRYYFEALSFGIEMDAPQETVVSQFAKRLGLTLS